MKSYLLLSFLFPSLIFCNPSGCEVIHGTAELQAKENLLQIHSSDQAILNWKNFSIAEGELTQFFLPSASSIVLNRVIEAIPSQILGSLQANGRIILINGSGIYFGESARIDVGGLLASTFDVLDEDFLRENFVFENQESGSIENLGILCATTGDLILIADTIENKGTLKASQGSVNLLSGHDILIQPKDSPQFLIKTKEDARPFILNEGTIEAVKIHIETSQNSYGLAFRHEGSIDALAIEELNGKVYLCTQGGLSQINGTISGNEVQILGDFLHLQDKANIDATGELGGTILVGGDYKGQNPDILNAKQLFVDEQASLSADATEAGNGGKIILWANEATVFKGHISAKGGSKQGDGGFVEVSSPGYYDFKGRVDTSAPHGKHGLLYLDPADVLLNNNPTSANIAVSAPNPITYTVTGNVPCPANILINAILTSLMTNDVRIDNSGAACANGDISINNAFNITAAQVGNLTLDAFRNITINAAVTNSSATTGLILNAGTGNAAGNISILNTITYNAGTSGVLTMTTQGGNISNSTAGTITLATTGATTLTTGGAGTMTFNAPIQNSTTGSVTLNGGTGAININTAAGTVRVSIGSSDGLTRVNAPNAALNLIGSTTGAGTRLAQLGFFTGAVGTSTGAINVNCNSLTMTGGVVSAGAQIGHGQPASIAVTSTPAAGTATITVVSGSTITMTGGTNSSPAKMGHGSFNMSVGVGCSQHGNISIQCPGNMTMQAVAGGTSHVIVGHGAINASVVNAPIANLQGNITVNVGGNLHMITPLVAGSQCSIGHYTATQGVGAFTGNIDILCGNDFFMDRGTLNNHMFVGHFAFGNTNPGGGLGTITGNYRVRVFNDFTMQTQGLMIFLGYKQLTNASNLGDPLFVGDVELIVGHNLTMNALGTQSPARFGTLGVFTENQPSATNVFVAVGNDLTIDDENRNVPLSIESPNNLFLAVQGDIHGAIPAAVPLAQGQIASIGTTSATAGTTFIRTLGSIDARGLNLGDGGGAGAGSLPPAPQARAMDVRAAGDITMGVGFTTNTGNIFIQADSNFDVGDLWVVNGGNLTQVAGGALSTPLPINQLAAPFQASVPAAVLPTDGLGAFQVDATDLVNRGLAATFLLFQNTTSGNLTINSADTLVNGGIPADLVLGRSANNLDINNSAGNICLSGSGSNCLTPSSSTDSHHNIVVNQIAIPFLNTSGFVYMSANNNLTVNPGSPITSSGVNGYITLVADNDDDGGGNLVLLANLSTTNTPIVLDAGFNALGGGSAILQIGTSAITSSGGPVTVQARGDILISGAVNSVSTTGGNFSATSQNGTVQIDENILTTNGNATVIANRGNITLSSATGTGGSITTQAGNLTLRAGQDINIMGDPTTLSTTTGFIHTTAGANTILTRNVSQAGAIAPNDILMISGLNMQLQNANITSTTSSVTLVVDNAPPNDFRPFIGSGIFIMDSTSRINSGPNTPLRIFTALQQTGASNNQVAVGALLNGQNPFDPTYNYPFAPFLSDTFYEVWCSYFSDDPNFPYPHPNLGNPFTFFYKPCPIPPVVPPVANLVVAEMQSDLHPTDEFLEWPDDNFKLWQFLLLYDKNAPLLPTSSYRLLSDEFYWMIRRKLRLIHHPYVNRSW